MTYNENNTVYDTIRREDVVDGVLTIPSGVTKITVDAARWQMDNSEAILEVIIPETVTEIGDRVFEHCFSLKKVHLHDNITCIGTRCFAVCANLQEINWPKNTRVIATGTFAESEICNLYLPKELRNIRDKAFSQTYVRHLHIEDIEYYTHIFFASKTASPFCEFTNLHIAGTAIDDSLTIKLSPSCLETNASIANFAFHNLKKIKTLTLVNVETIGKSSFENTGFEVLKFDCNLKELFENAFSKCKSINEIHFGSPELFFPRESFPEISTPVVIKITNKAETDEYCFPEFDSKLLSSLLQIPDDFLPF